MRGIGFALCARAMAVAPLVVVAWLLGLGATWVSGAAAASPVVEGQPLDRSAGWHGRAVRDVHRHERRAVSRPAGSSGPLRPGTGAARPGGSVRVRELQRRLRGLGYRPGPVDGVLGPRTRAAAAWFAHKHGLRVSGAVDAATVTLLGERSRGAGERTRVRAATRVSDPPRGGDDSRGAARRGDAGRSAPAATPVTTSAAMTTDGVASGTWLVIALAAAAIVLSTIGAGLVLRRRRQAQAAGSPVYELWVQGRSPDPDIGAFEGVVTAVSVPEEPRPRGWTQESQYRVSDPSRPETFWVPATAVEQLGAARQEPAGETGPRRALGYVTSQVRNGEAVEAIEATCAASGWELTKVIHERADPRRRSAGRPGLRGALDRLAAGDADVMVVGRLSHLARTFAELGVLLDWFSEHDATLVICDIDLDTSTPAGRRSAQTLATVSAWETLPDHEPSRPEGRRA